MAKRTKAVKTAKFKWALQIEFTGLIVAEPFFKQKKMIIHLIDDPQHVPAFSARIRDVRLSEDCRPSYTVLSPDSEGEHAATLGVWPILRGAAMSLFPPDKPPFDLDIPHKKVDPCETHKCSDSISALANLNRLLSARRCVPNANDPTFLLVHGRVVSGRCDPKLLFKIMVDGDEVFRGNLPLSVVYTLNVVGRDPVVIDVNPGKISIGPPKDAESGYVVATTVTNFPTPHMTSADLPHFMEYNRIAGTDFDIDVLIEQVGQFPDDPIHCVPATLGQEI